MNGDNQTRQILLATMVLAGVVTEDQLTELIESGEAVPETWQEIVKKLRQLNEL